MDAGMTCSTARELISARADGEADRGQPGGLDGHLDGCPACRAWEGRVHDLRRRVVLRQPLPPADLADRVVARLSVPHAGVGGWVRYALGVVAASLVVLNLPALLGLDSGPADHQGRHLGTFGVALGVGLLWAAIRPERAIGLVPLAVALAAATLAGAAVDVGVGRVGVVTEATHLLELVGVGLLWFLSGGADRLQARARHLRHLRRPLPTA
jgi:predicted anti-sigma-YlaC factor YlaD